MLKEIKRVLEKYQQIAMQSEYVNIAEVTSDLYMLIKECRIKRLPKSER